MKNFNKTYLPEVIEYNGSEYRLNVHITSAMHLNNTSPATISNTLKQEGRKAVMVSVLPKQLKGRTDLHGRPYQPTKHIFTDQ